MNEVLLINKEKNISSAEELNKLKRIIKEEKVGHTGTLDPIATGVLVVLIGKCTKLSNYLTSLEKEYIATVKVGISTDTLDITGHIENRSDKRITKDELEKVLLSYKKDYEQTVPFFSSVRVSGRHLYEYARDLEEVDLPKRKVSIKDIELLNYSLDEFSFRCVVSKGTYIRSLINDILKDAGIIGTMKGLIRTKQGKFLIEDSYTLEDIEKGNYKFIPLEELFDNIVKKEIPEELKVKIMNGNIIKKESNEDYVFFYEKDILKVIYHTYDKDNTLMKPILFL